MVYSLFIHHRQVVAPPKTERSNTKLMASNNGTLDTVNQDEFTELLGGLVEKAREEKARNANPERERIMRNLEELGGLTVGDDALFFAGDKFILPSQFAGNVRGAVRYLQEWEKGQE